MSEGDELLLLANGVYGVLADAEINMPLQQLRESGKLYALEDDLLARGITASGIPPQTTTISYEDFVDLVVKHQNTYNWV
jgi:tRNA 2-thiouridine synthesizing protein B